MLTGFESNRPHLRAVAYRMLGSFAEADDALQEAWLRVSGTDPAGIENLRGWLTTVVARVCLNLLRARRSRPLEVHMPDPIVDPASGVDPEHEVLLADAIGLAMQVVIETLAPAERLAFVLHDVFGVPFEEIAPIVGRSTTASRQLASRARRRVRGAPVPDADLRRQWRAVEAFRVAGRNGDFEALLEVLDPEIVLRSDGGAARPRLTTVLHGAVEVAAQALTFTRLAGEARPVLVNGAPGALVAPGGKPFVLMAFTVIGERILAIDILADPERLAQLDLAVLDS
jgi:RNA polymerase sigma factor (sigma-70 family)